MDPPKYETKMLSFSIYNNKITYKKLHLCFMEWPLQIYIYIYIYLYNTGSMTVIKKALKM
jgi:hypothetical protein